VVEANIVNRLALEFRFVQPSGFGAIDQDAEDSGVSKRKQKGKKIGISSHLPRSFSATARTPGVTLGHRPRAGRTWHQTLYSRGEIRGSLSKPKGKILGQISHCIQPPVH